jgi:hypothetical protein
MGKIGGATAGISRRWPEHDSALLHAVGGIGPYSREVPQRVWIPVDCLVLAGTVTCADGLLWTGCRWMACKRSGVRIPIAPLGIPVQSTSSGPSGWVSRSVDRHLRPSCRLRGWFGDHLPGSGGLRPPRASIASATRAAALRNPKAIRVMTLILVFTDSFRPLLSPWSRVAWMLGRWRRIFFPSSVNSGMRQRVAQDSQRVR